MFPRHITQHVSCHRPSSLITSYVVTLVTHLVMFAQVTSHGVSLAVFIVAKSPVVMSLLISRHVFVARLSGGPAR